jgi:signal transduction histidine kinase/DNA-binding response OmpR family regulator
MSNLTDGIWLHVRVLTRQFGLPEAEVRDALASGTLRSRQEGGQRLIAMADLDAWVRTRATGPAAVVVHPTLESEVIHQQLQRANQLAQVGTMALSVGHEINNPLTYVLSNCAFIQEDVLPTLTAPGGLAPAAEEALEELTEMLGEIEEGATHIRRVVAELRGLTRTERVTRPMLPAALIDAAVRMAGPALNTSVRLSRVDQSDREIAVHMSSLVQVLINLLTNAVHAVQGRIDPTIAVRSRDAGAFVVIEVADNGCGIPSEQLARVFDPFFTTKPVNEGTGLGLAVCRRIMNDLGGELTLDSRVGEGTTVRIALPVPTEPARAEPAPPTATGLAGLRVLVIDDQAAILRSLKRMLEPLGLDVHTEADPHRAAERLIVGEHDLVLCDLMMPGLTGMGVYRQVHDRRPELCSRFVFMSGGPASEEARAFCVAHEHRLVLKPMTTATVSAALQAAAERPRGVSEPCPNIRFCPMFPKFQSQQMLSIYKQTYCEATDQTYTRCARYRTMKSGERPSPLLLPHGEELPAIG